jgi:hypothetical protein
MSPIVRSQATRPPSSPGIATVWLPDRIAYRPVINADREGVHCASGAKLSSFVREGVDPACVRPPKDSATVAAEFAITEVVD